MAMVVRNEGRRANAVARAVLEVAGEMLQRQAARRASRPRDGLASVLGPRRHPLAPAAVRVERSRVRDDRGAGDQTALTVWFGEPPALPGPALPASSGLSARTVLSTAAGITGMIALGALGVIATQRDTRRLSGTPVVPRIGR